ncbi:YdeI/OmpD-associated family protein [Culicoidibacter larvae]|uniref:DUF1905 domain-containing protein n=1 Tax=Culicoidibacter larvae TaxID=2579976 RepID=A0A5R8QD24_9FIRM|nr:YdeI/OmpD-associated family protein [Culicoidibacter larvae]TLG73002.1 DUF1905 domain-containing protein [Culicoidibacter larvae]
MYKYKFDAIIATTGPGAYVEFPYDVQEEFGKGRVKVEARFDGQVIYRGSLVRMQTPCHILGIRKDILKALGKGIGDQVTVELKEDLAVREVEVPTDLAERFADNQAAKQFFQSLSYTNQRKYVEWITSAKKAETRESRIEQTIVMLAAGQVK